MIIKCLERNILPNTTLVVVLVGCLWAASGHSDFLVPEITINEASTARTVHADASFIDPVHGHLFPEDEHQFNGRGFWRRSASVKGFEVEAEASHKSWIDKFSIRGEGTAKVDSFGEALASAENTFFISFSVPIDASFSFSANFAFDSGENGEGPPAPNAFNYVGQILFSGLEATEGEGVACTNGIVSVDIQEEATWEQTCTGTVAAGNGVTLVFANATAHPGGTAGTSGTSFEFELNFGDRDHDGLLDVWEEEGIPLPEAGISLNLPELGAHPDRKDIFVEIETMNGALLDPEVLDRVEAAFADVPASLADNYDGSAGIRLHLIRDDDSPANTALTLNADNSLPASYYAIKRQTFNTSTAREHQHWIEMRDALLHVFRFGLWVDQLLDSCGNDVSGQAEGVPSNDFIIATNPFINLAAIPEIEMTEDDLTNAFAGTLMHELGHTLGLQHGGADNSANFKPNYLSVMSYAYQFPWPKALPEDGHARDAFKLDYSRATLRALDEFALIESEGLNGPEGRNILFNSAADDAMRPRLTMAPASASEINWNHDFSVDTADPIIGADPLSPPVDLSRFLFQRKIDCETVEIPPSHEVLTSDTDWDSLEYAITGVTWENDDTPSPSAAQAATGIGWEDILSILNADWVNQAFGTGPLIFRDSFESGASP